MSSPLDRILGEGEDSLVDHLGRVVLRTVVGVGNELHLHTRITVRLQLTKVLAHGPVQRRDAVLLAPQHGHRAAHVRHHLRGRSERRPVTERTL